MSLNRQARLLLVFGAILAVVAGAWVTLPQATNHGPVERNSLAASGGSGILDGMTFAGVLGQMGEPGDVPDTFVFANGTFHSAECDKRCGYPARPYYVRYVGEAVEFISESHCLYKDARIVWRGTVDGGTIIGVSMWTVNRWYWTIQKEFWFEGELVKHDAPTGHNE